MPVSAIVVTLAEDEAQRRDALARLGEHPCLMLGELVERQLPVVVDTDTIREGIDIVRTELPAVPGVEFVHVVSVDFGDVEDFGEKLPPKRRQRRQ